MRALDHELTRTVYIKATPATVFGFFQDSVKWANWWGAGSTIDPSPGGNIYIRYPNGVEARGRVQFSDPPRSLSFSFWYASGSPVAEGASQVLIELDAEPDGGTTLRLTHEFAEAAMRDHHVQGWRYQLAVFANTVCAEAYAGAGLVIDSWFEAWATADDATRLALLERIATPEVRFADRFSLVEGTEELSTQIGAALRFMPGIRMRRKGAVRQCQGTALADWSAEDSNGKVLMQGTNLYEFAPDGRIERASGFASQ